MRMWTEVDGVLNKVKELLIALDGHQMMVTRISNHTARGKGNLACRMAAYCWEQE